MESRVIKKTRAASINHKKVEIPQDVPLKISWILQAPSGGAFPRIELLEAKDQVVAERTLFGLCSAPGKKLTKGRDGKSHDRDITKDVFNFKERGVDCIVCLLSKYELRTLGVDISVYAKACSKVGIDLIIYPIVEMAAPEQKTTEFDTELIEKLRTLVEANESVVVHCRGGIGRAGLVACCLLLKMKLAKSPSDAIKIVRKLRDPRSVESRKQEDYIEGYYGLINSQR